MEKYNKLHQVEINLRQNQRIYDAEHRQETVERQKGCDAEPQKEIMERQRGYDAVHQR